VGWIAVLWNKMVAKSYIFKVRVEEDRFEDGREAFHAFCPALKGCHTWGHTYNEALANLREAVELYVEDLRESGESIPLDTGPDVEAWPTPAVAVNV
jgi:predicted RNase H-like HicB family nuclease